MYLSENLDTIKEIAKEYHLNWQYRDQINMHNFKPRIRSTYFAIKRFKTAMGIL